MEYLFEPNGELTYARNDAAERNLFLAKQPRTQVLPLFEQSRNQLPEPVWDGHVDTLRCYWKAWEIAFSNLRNPVAGSGFVSPFIDTAFNGFLFLWDSAFITMFGRYGSRAFDFQQTLDNFYASQHRDGFICRELCEQERGGHFARHDPASTGPAVLTWSEWEYYVTTADRQRLSSVFDPLLAYHRWMKLNRTWRDGTYWSSGWGCGMDNQPRLQPGYDICFSHGHQIWVDTCMQALLDARLLAKMATELGRTEALPELDAEAERLCEQINSLLWSQRDAFYYDLWRDGRQNGVKSVGSYWGLLADAVPPERKDAFVAHLENPAEFNRPNRIPSLSADHPEYDPNGGYWRGGVWAPTNYMVLKGLEHVGETKLAHRIAVNHLRTVTEVFCKTGTLWENYSPERNEQGLPAKSDFVGWTGLVPVSVFFEFVMGIHGNPVQQSILWEIRLTDRHGILRYPFGDATVDLICEQRKNDGEEPVVHVRSDVPVTLEIKWNGNSKRIRSE